MVNIEKSRQFRVHVERGGDWKVYVREMPRGHTPIGVVRCGNGQPGALAYIEARGEYVQLNEGSATTLDQRKVKAALEAPRARGRPRKNLYELTEPYTVRLAPSDASEIIELGDGNLATGIAKLLEEHRARS